MREVGRFAVLDSRRLTDLWTKRVVDYVGRQNADGGYTFVGRRGIQPRFLRDVKWKI